MFKKTISILLYILIIFIVSGCSNTNTNTNVNVNIKDKVYEGILNPSVVEILDSNLTDEEKHLIITATNRAHENSTIENLVGKKIGEIINESAEQSYKNGIEYLKKKDYENAWDELIKLGPKYSTLYPDVATLTNYASIQKRFKKHGALVAVINLKEIPLDYNGQFAEEIKLFREKLNGLQDTYDKEREAQLKERESKIHIGDSKEKLERLWGKPATINRTVTKSGTREQWVYNNTYIYIEDGYIVSFQESR